MKPSKLMFALAGIMTVAGASALTTDEIMARCNSSKDTVWDSYNKTCVPRNPCKKDGYDKYCNKNFVNTQLNSVEHGKTLAKAYAKFTDGQDAACSELDKPGVLGQDYIGCTYNNGHYVVFEFDDLSQLGREKVPNYMFEFEEYTNAEDNCYGFEKDVSQRNGQGHIGNWVKSDVTPRMCLVSFWAEAGAVWKFCSEDFLGSTKLLQDTLVMGLTPKSGFDICKIQEDKNTTSPDGTNVGCFEVHCEYLY